MLACHDAQHAIVMESIAAIHTVQHSVTFHTVCWALLRQSNFPLAKGYRWCDGSSYMLNTHLNIAVIHYLMLKVPLNVS